MPLRSDWEIRESPMGGTMKGTIIDYLKEYANVSLKDEPMNDVDSLVLCQFSYLKFDGLVPPVTESGSRIHRNGLTRHRNP